MQLYQGLSRNLFFKKHTFYLKGCVAAPDRATRLFFRILVDTYQAFQMRYRLFLKLDFFSHKFIENQNEERGVLIHLHITVGA